tara:strand:- start:5031 stop:6107 length:1077 start_codon:yes stop_codon:yes gene_type:complete
MKFLLIGFKLSIGIEQYLISLKKALEVNGKKVELCGDKNQMIKLGGNPISNSSSTINIILDTFNPLVWIKFATYVKSKSPTYSVFISSHPLNFISIMIIRLISRTKILSVIHDPMPHSGDRFKIIILISQFLQLRLSHKVIVAGIKLKDEVSRIYAVNNKNIHVMYIGNNRNIVPKFLEKNKRAHFSLLGRIEDYKGIDVFLKAAKKVIDTNITDVKFILAGQGNLNKYKPLIDQIDASRLRIRNKLISDEEFDFIISTSFAVVMPYNDATQTGTIQIANSLSTPCIVTNVGSLPELVIKNETGIIVNPKSPEELANAMIELSSNAEKLIRMEKNSYEFFKNKLNWTSNVKNFLNELN